MRDHVPNPRVSRVKLIRDFSRSRYRYLVLSGISDLSFQPFAFLDPRRDQNMNISAYWAWFSVEKQVQKLLQASHLRGLAVATVMDQVRHDPLGTASSTVRNRQSSFAQATFAG